MNLKNHDYLVARCLICTLFVTFTEDQIVDNIKETINILSK